ncbi:MAG: aldehyde ferredoxin oxidoreductase C-terminal domain-containing protein, partial [Planctomycetota bacterium]|nr:aldehyde ferredoxin oxidoreductase C-terminal domain-containing protein [Planctomycetota bacterium]
MRERFRKSEGVKFFAKHGTSYGVDNYNELGMLPTRNFQSGVFEGTAKIGKEACLEFEKTHVACYACPVGCSAIREVREGLYSQASSEGPEYETLFAFGSQCGNDYLPAIIAADEMCDRLGLDTISTGNVIGFAMECFQQGLITEKDTDGVSLTFGNHEAMVDMVRKIAAREGFGAVLSDGSLRASIVIGKGSSKLAMQVKGSELAGFDPRGAMAMGLGFATSPRGGDHERAYVFAEVGTVPPLMDRFTTEGKAKLLKFVQDEESVVDALGICCFLGKGEPIGLPDYAALFTHATGIEMSTEQLMLIG